MSEMDLIEKEMPPIALPWLKRWCHVRTEIQPIERFAIMHSLLIAELDVISLEPKELKEFTTEFYELLHKYLRKVQLKLQGNNGN